MTTIKVEVDHDLRRDVFAFYYDDLRNQLKLCDYLRMERKTKRHKFAEVARFPSRRPLAVVREYEVPLTPSIIATAYQRLVEYVQAVRLPGAQPEVPGGPSLTFQYEPFVSGSRRFVVVKGCNFCKRDAQMGASNLFRCSWCSMPLFAGGGQQHFGPAHPPAALLCVCCRDCFCAACVIAIDSLDTPVCYICLRYRVKR